MEETSKKQKEVFTIPKKALFGIAPAVAIVALLLSKGDMGPLLLFIVGIAAGLVIGKGYYEVHK